MEQVIQVRHDSRSGGTLSGKAVLRLLAILIVSMGIVAPSPCSSFAANGVDVMDRELNQNRPAPRSQPKIQITEDGQLSGVSEGEQFTLLSLQIVGSTVFSEEELVAPYRKLFGMRISFADLNAITTELTKKYRDSGYLLSRVIIPEQEVEQAGAAIRLLVVEGYIESIEYTGDSRVLERFKNYFAPAEKSSLARNR